MIKQGLIQFLNKCIETLDEFIEICKSDVEINEVVDNIKFIDKYGYFKVYRKEFEKTY